MVSFTFKSTYFIINIYNSTLKEDKISGVYTVILAKVAFKRLWLGPGLNVN